MDALLTPVQTTSRKLPTFLTTVTVFSKFLAIVLFITLPFIGFYFGIRFQQKYPDILLLESKQTQRNSTKTSPNLIPSISPLPSQATNPNPESKLTPKYTGNNSIEIKINKDSPCNQNSSLVECKSDIYLKDNSTNMETYVFTIDNVVPVNYGQKAIYKNGYIYLLRQIGYSQKQLWVYTEQNHGKQLTSDPYLVASNFIVDPSGSKIAIERRSLTSVSSFSIVSINQEDQIKNFAPNVKECVSEGYESMGELGFEAWVENAIWGGFYGEYGAVGCYWKVNVETGELTYYRPTGAGGLLGYFNPEKMFAVYTTVPPMVDYDTYKDWLSSHPTTSLYIYNLATHQNTLIKTFPSTSSLSIKGWTTPTELNYLIDKQSFIYKLP